LRTNYLTLQQFFSDVEALFATGGHCSLLSTRSSSSSVRLIPVIRQTKYK